MPVSEAKKRANRKYDAAHYTIVGAKIKKEDAAEFKRACAAAGTTPSDVIKNAIAEFMRGRSAPEDGSPPEDNNNSK